MAETVPFTCEGCHKHPSDGTTVFRINPKGVRPGRWRCLPCLTALPQEEWPTEEVQRLTAIVERQHGAPIQ